MFETLIETKRTRNRKRALGVGFVSLTLHTAIIAAAVIATLNAGASESKVRVDTAMVYLEQQQQQKPPEPQPVQLDVPLKGFQTVIAPTEIPTNIPPVNLQEHFDPKDYSGSGVEGGSGTGVVPTGNEVFMEAIVEEKPVALSAPLPTYPPLLQQAGIQGRVTVQFVVDTMGRVRPSSVTIKESSNPGFDGSARNYVTHMIFRPARMHGRAVQCLLEQPVVFQIR